MSLEAFVRVLADPGSYGRNVVELLAEAYRAQVRPHTPEYEQLLEKLVMAANSWEFAALATVVAKGDPRYWPGLTAPAVEAFGSFFAAPPPAPASTHASIYEKASRAFDACWERGKDESYWLRLQPLVDGLGELLLRTRKDEGVVFCVRAATAIRTLPPTLLDGVFVSWVQAFTQRARLHELGAEESAVLGT
jgi:hypothetical protein